MSDTNISQLIFVYNADSGLFNTMADIAHKLFSPGTYQCNLCAITHTALSMRDDWKQFIQTIPCEVTYLHRDELPSLGNFPSIELPVILSETDGHYEEFVSARELNDCKQLADLIALINSRLKFSA
jgi:hypothetical protein